MNNFDLDHYSIEIKNLLREAETNIEPFCKNHLIKPKQDSRKARQLVKDSNFEI